MGLDSHITVSISVADAAVAKDSFDTLMIVAYHEHFPDTVREYTSAAAMATDGFDLGESAYLAAAAAFAQNPRITKVKIGKRSAAVDQVIYLTPTVRNSTVYSVTITDPSTGTATECSFTSDSTADLAEVLAGIETAINNEFTGLASDVSGTHVELNAGAYPDNYYAVKVGYTKQTDGTPNIARSEQSSAAGTLGTDLTAILTADPDWYAFVVADGQDPTHIEAASAWAESNSKIYIASTADEEICSAGTGVAADIKGNTRYRTAVFHTRAPGTYPCAASFGQMLSANPGSQTWAYKTLAGVTVQEYTDTHISNMNGDNCNYYFTLGGLNVTYPGKMAQGRFIDIQRGIDWFQNEIQTNILSKLGNVAKVPMTDAGVAIIKGCIFQAIEQADNYGLLASSPAPTVSAPLVSAISSANKANRLLPDVTFSATLAGAIHTVTITGTVSV